MNFTLREKRFIFAGLIFLFILIIYFSFNYLNDHIFSLDAKIKEAQIDEANMIQYGKEFKKLAVLRTSDKIDLDPMIPQIESLLQKYGVRNNATLQPSDSIIENKFLKRLVSIEFKEIDASSILNIIRELEDHNTIPYTIEYFQTVPITNKAGIYRISMKIAAFKNKE
ncbi:MAG: hypothetical protein OEV78_01065 [Spirochaetia bacterium]|nr:hypothetical protein [Spirochaetia bacterium]